MRKKREKEFDFKPLGKAIRLLREEEGLTREQGAEIVDIDPRYYAKIEDNGQYPSLAVLLILAKMFHISLDEFVWPDNAAPKTTKRRNIDKLINGLSEDELEIIKGTIRGISGSKN
jgi:transcriptional regulator with XRE-family HTH domain